MTNARIRFGILGTANIAIRRFIPGALSAHNAVAQAIASRDLPRAREVAARFAIPSAYGSYRELLDDPEIDAVYIPLPNTLHAEWTIAAAEAGKAILCEKPLGATSNEAQRMIDAARANGVLLMEAFMYRFHPQHARVREILDADEIGDVRAVRTAFTFQLEPFDPANVRLQRELAGGALMDVGCYCVNAARMLFGEEPEWASAQWDFRADFGVEVSLAGVLTFSDARTATFDCGFRAAGQGSYTVAGTKGQIDVPTAFVPQPVDTTIRVISGSASREERIPGVDQYCLEAIEFADALLRSRPLRIPPEDAVATLRAIEALHRSAAAGGLRERIMHA